MHDGLERACAEAMDARTRVDADDVCLAVLVDDDIHRHDGRAQRGDGTRGDQCGAPARRGRKTSIRRPRQRDALGVDDEERQFGRGSPDRGLDQCTSVCVLADHDVERIAGVRDG